jgi:hypothetical protein
MEVSLLKRKINNGHTLKQEIFMKVKVFLSSTYDDLKEIREFFIRTMETVGFKVICMEDSDEEPISPVDNSRAMVSQCDIFVGIYAHRYGTIPQKLKKSLIEIEYDLAGECDKVRHCFLSSKEYKCDMASTDYNNPEKWEKLLKFKGRICKNEIVGWFKEKDELEPKIEKFAQKMKREFLSFSEDNEEDQYYVERPGLIRLLNEAKRSPVIVVSGAAGTGKSTQVKHFLKKEIGNPRIIEYICDGKLPLNHALPEALEGKLSKATSDCIKNEPHNICKYLFNAAELQRKSLILDDFEKAKDVDFINSLITETKTLKKKKNQAAGSYRTKLIIITNEPTELAEAWYFSVEVSVMKKEEALDFIRCFADKSIRRRLTDSQAESIANDCLYYPYLIKRTLEILKVDCLVDDFKRMLFNRRLDPDLIEQLWRQLKPTLPIMSLEYLLDLINEHNRVDLEEDFMNLLYRNLYWTKVLLFKSQESGKLLKEANELRHKERGITQISSDQSFKPEPIFPFLSDSFVKDSLLKSLSQEGVKND